MAIDIPFKIAGVGHYLPERIIDNDYIESRAKLPSGWVKKRTGIEQRRWAESETNAFMGAVAAREAIESAGSNLEDIDLIINASGTFQRAIPDGACLIQRELGLGGSGVECMTVHTTCLSFLSAMQVSASFLKSGLHKNILIVSSEIASRGLNFNEPASAALFGDGAAAVLATRPENHEPSKLESFHMETFGHDADLATIMAGAARYPYQDGTTIEDSLFHMNGKKLVLAVLKHSQGFLDRVEDGLSKRIDSFDIIIPHQTTMLALQSLSRVGIQMEKVAITLPYLGNCVAASIPLTLYEAFQSGKLVRGSRCLFLGSGAGLSLAAAVLTW